jgi:hypothetical protein
MNKYNNSKIYKIVCNESNNIYYGSTIQPLYKRINDHKKAYRRYLKDKFHYLTSFEIIKNNNFNIILVENINCNSKEELEKIERIYIDNNICINKYRPTRTKKEYCEEHKDHLNELQKIYYEENKETISNQRKEKYKLMTNEERLEKNRKARENYNKRKSIGTIDNQYTKND